MPVALLTWYARPRGAWRALGVADDRASQPNGFLDVLNPRACPKGRVPGLPILARWQQEVEERKVVSNRLKRRCEGAAIVVPRA